MAIEDPPLPRPTLYVGLSAALTAPSVPPAFATPLGRMFAGDALKVLRELPRESIDLVVTSPPYALHFKKEYGNADKAEYVNWFLPFAAEIYRVLAPAGSFVLNIGGSYDAGSPTRSLYHFRLLLKLCDELNFHLAQELFWYNPGKLPAPAEWVNVRRIRVKDSVEYLWWLSKSSSPKADNRSVLMPYSKDMIRILEKGYRAKTRPSGHKITHKFHDRGGAIPANLLEEGLTNLIEWGNNESNSEYLKLCDEYGVKPHPARFAAVIPEFFVRFLTDPGDVVMDPFAGSNVTGRVAENLGRQWVAIEIEPRYVEGARLRFLHELALM